MKMKKLIFFILYIVCVSCLNFNINNVKHISLNEETSDNRSTYFGYSLLLQKGSSPIVIVGAPKNDPTSGGAVYACDALKEEGCDQYNIRTDNNGTENGNFLGGALDGSEIKGQPFIVCAPRKMSKRGLRNFKQYYELKGFCVYQRNSAILNDNAPINLEPLKGRVSVSTLDETVFYDHSYGQAGIDVHYMKELQSALLGAPGIRDWNGAMVSQFLKNAQESTIIPSSRVAFKIMDLLGYTVSSINIGGIIHSIAGAPRANHLLGKVVVYNGVHEKKSIQGYEIGSYFGSSIVSQDVNNDDMEDLFIGAPTGKGSTFEEGYVYVYPQAGRNTAKLLGSKITGARFGTSIAALGDIDLDSFKDIAISAPFEDDGTGAVYIYLGSLLGVESSFSQRLLPKKFNGNFVNVKGFGLGLSKGNDIDGNGHNDLAIGAYKSGEVFILKTKSIIDYKMTLDSNVTALKINQANNIPVNYCVYYKQRSSTNDLQFVDFNLELTLDYRVQGQRNHTFPIKATKEELTCHTTDVVTVASPDITPFSMSLAPLVPEDIFGVGDAMIEKSIVFSHGCGDDGVCQTRITLDVDTKPTIVSGLDKQIDVSLTVKNKGEPGYQCELHLQVPPEVDYRRKKGCNAENSTHLICPFGATLITERKMVLEFDIISYQPFKDDIEIGFDIKCTGVNLEPDSAESAIIGMVVKQALFIEGKTDTANVYYEEETDEIEIKHSFVIGNSGPSPFKLDVHLLLPMVQADGTDIFELVDTKGMAQGNSFFCNETEYTNSHNLASQLPTSAPLNKTILLDCQDDAKCSEIICQGDFLYASESAKIDVTVKVRTKPLEKHFHKQLEENDAIGYLVVGFIPHTERIESSSISYMIFSQKTNPVPIRVWILAGVLGIIVLVAVIFLLYKCHFFDRNYRDKMNDEKLMDETEKNLGDSSNVLHIFDDPIEEDPEENLEETQDEQPQQ